MKICFIVLAAVALCCHAQSNAFFLVRGDLIGNTQYLHWKAFPTNIAIIARNFTNDWPPPITNLKVQYEGWGWIQSSTDAVNWMNRTVYWLPFFIVTNNGALEFFRAPAVPPLYPTNGPAFLPQ